MRRLPIAVISLTCAAAAVIGNTRVEACTGFCAVGGGKVLVGNNEDWTNPRTRIWFVPATPGSYGRMYVGFDDLYPQGGMNERGLWFDGFAAPPVSAATAGELPIFPGNLIERALAECATVEEVVRLFSQYDRSFLAQAILMYADGSGDAVSIERNAIVRKTAGHFVQTNFHQSLLQGPATDGRFVTASTMLERAGTDISVDLFRRILARTHQKGGAPTLYSNIYDLRARTMHLYYFHDFEHAVTFDLLEELGKGPRVLEIPALFPRHVAAEAFAARASDRNEPSIQAISVALVVFAAVIVAGAGYASVRGGRRARYVVAALAGAAAMSIAAIVVTLRMSSQASPEWMEFSIGPASGRSVNMQPGALRANGITLRAAVAIAYDIPAVRVIAPPWVADTRYSMQAVLGIDKSESLSALLRQELERRLRLERHIERRPFDAFVLTAGEGRRLERSGNGGPSVSVRDGQAHLVGADMQMLADTLQNILGGPVINETGITGPHDLDFEWTNDRVTSVRAILLDRYGLRLSPDRREMEALIVDRIRRDAALVLFEQVGRITQTAPPRLREGIADLLRIH